MNEDKKTGCNSASVPPGADPGDNDPEKGNGSDGLFKDAFQGIVADFPSKPQFKMPVDSVEYKSVKKKRFWKRKDNTAAEAAERVNQSTEDAFEKLIQSEEAARIKRQTTIIHWLMFFVFISVVSFNFIFIYITCKTYNEKPLSPEVLEITSNLTKYYIAAIIAELLAYLFFIISKTFSSHSSSIVAAFWKKKLGVRGKRHKKKFSAKSKK